MLELKEYLLQLAIRSRIADKGGNDDYKAGPYIWMALYPINRDGHRNWPVISFQGNNPMSSWRSRTAAPQAGSRQSLPGS